MRLARYYFLIGPRSRLPDDDDVEKCRVREEGIIFTQSSGGLCRTIQMNGIFMQSLWQLAGTSPSTS